MRSNHLHLKFFHSAAGNRRIPLWIFYLLLLSGCASYSENCVPSHRLNSVGDKTIEFVDRFDEPDLNPSKWRITSKGDFKEATADISGPHPRKQAGSCLRLSADTIGTDDKTIKYHGAACLHKIEFDTGKTISVDIDWNAQKNGCYLSAAIYICPELDEEGPQDKNNWLRIEYVGVPPGINARCAVSARTDNKERLLYGEGWPENKEGRNVSYQKIDIILDRSGLEIIENGKSLYATGSHGLNFSSGYLYLMISSHSNYSSREIYFDNVIIKKIKPDVP